jgi:hypothetical protein
VPARLIGERLRVHLYDDRLECYLGTTEVATRPRIYAPKGKRRARSIDYRHLIGSLVKKPMAFFHSQLRDDLLPSEVYRRIWQGLERRLDPRAACKLMVGVLALAADYDCEAALGAYLLQTLERRGPPYAGRVTAPFRTPPASHPTPTGAATSAAGL